MRSPRPLGGGPKRPATVPGSPHRDRPPSSSGLGRLPFTQVTRVRIPLGVPRTAVAPVRSGSDLVRRAVSGLRSALAQIAWSRGAAWSARRPVKPEVAGSNPVGTANQPKNNKLARKEHPTGRVVLGRVAQLAERPPEKRKVTGSTPVPTTIRRAAVTTAARSFLKLPRWPTPTSHGPGRSEWTRRLERLATHPVDTGRFSSSTGDRWGHL